MKEHGETDQVVVCIESSVMGILKARPQGSEAGCEESAHPYHGLESSWLILSSSNGFDTCLHRDGSAICNIYLPAQLCEVAAVA